VAQEIFDGGMAGANQLTRLREDVVADRDALLRTPVGTITRAGIDGNVEVCVRYLAAWLDGQGCVPIHWLMEDAATAEICRAQLWQWLHHADGRPTDERPTVDGNALFLDDGTPVDFTLFDRALLALPSKLPDRTRLPGAGRIEQAIALLDELTRADELADFLTLSAYELL
jgi:malate synthase